MSKALVFVGVLTLFSVTLWAGPTPSIEPGRLNSLDSSTGKFSWWISASPKTPAAHGLSYEGRLDNPGADWRRGDVPVNLLGKGLLPSGTRKVWYRLAFYLEKMPDHSLSVALGEISDRDRVYLNGEQIGATGVWDSPAPQAYDRERVYEIPGRLLRPGQTNVFLIQVQSYFPDELGIYRGQTTIGPTRALIKNRDNENMFQVNILMIYMAVGGYFLFLFIRRRRDRENLYFALFAIGLIFYHFLRTQLKYDLGFPFVFTKQIQYLTLFTIFPSFYYFIRNYFKALPTKSVRRGSYFMLGVTSLTFACALGVLFTDDATNWAKINQLLIQPLWLIYTVAVLKIVITRVIARNRDAQIMVLSLLIMLISIFLDILTSRTIINLPTLTTYGFLVFVISLALILANRFVRLNNDTERLNRNLRKTNSAYSRFVPREFLSILGRKNIMEIKLGDQIQKEMTVFFSDIRSFTSLSETMTPEENFNFLNSYLKHMTPFVAKNHGFIDKYIGDSVMALFPEGPGYALDAAVAMQKDIISYNNIRAQKGYAPIEIGVGIHTGSLMLGIIGARERMEGTVISDAVNLGARLEGTTKTFGVGIAVSGDALQKIPDYETRYNIRFLGELQVKGKIESVSVYEVMDGLAPEALALKKSSLEDFNRGLEKYRAKEFAEARDLLQKVLSANPEDKAAELYLDRSRYFLENSVTEDWTPVEKMDHK